MKDVDLLYNHLINCVVVTFSQRSYKFGPDKSGETVPFPINVSYFSGIGSYNVRLMINNNPALSKLSSELSFSIVSYQNLFR